MGNPDHIAVAQSGVVAWDRWRAANLRVQPDLTRADLADRDLRGIDFRGVGLFKANLSGADLRGAILRQSILIKTDLRGADLTGAHVYGAAVWDVKINNHTMQRDLIVTEPRDATLTVDNLEMAQFIHLMITNRKLRDVIDTITSKVVLILGRFSAARLAVLDCLKEHLRGNNLLPVVFDFTPPRSRDMTETVRTLAHLARFVVADLTAPRCVPHEICAILPDLAVPLAPIISARARPYAMFRDLKKYPWLLDLFRYRDADDLTEHVLPKLVRAVDAKLGELHRT